MRKTAMFAVLALTTAVAAAAQAGPQVEVLKLDAQPPNGAPAKAPLLIGYSGSLGSGVYVRVFRGTKHSLMVDLPKRTPDGECVVYNSTVPIEVAADGKMLHVDGIVQFFDDSWYAEHQVRQTFTLVFERGKHNAPDGHLRLNKPDAARYFKYAIEWTLNAPGDKINEYQAQKAQQTPGLVQNALNKVAAVFGGGAVYAKEKATTPIAPAIVIAGHNCQVVKEVDALLNVSPATTSEVATESNAPAEPLDPNAFAVRSTSACGD